jgi:sterol desaturase/sphingolipid hydroxylase (fatty acid hydroxylase superfamily)
MILPDVSQPAVFLWVTLVIFAIVIGRYLLIAGIFHAVFYLWYPEKWAARKISKRAYKPDQFRKEIKWSTITASLFAVSGTLLLLMWQKGFTKVYFDVNEYPLWWLPLSLLVAMLVHETYYYWLHRAMHHPKLFPIMHKVHHDSNITSPWTAFSFHPLEGILQAIFLPLLLMVLPVHIYVLLLHLTIMTFSSVINHLDIELYPKKFNKHFIGRWLIGASHHSLHHKQFRYNYGLYFTFWDKWKKTESPQYDELFEKQTSNRELNAEQQTEFAVVTASNRESGTDSYREGNRLEP